MGAKPDIGMPFARTPMVAEVRAPMKVSIGVDPHKESVAVAAVEEIAGELVERAGFPQDLEKALEPSSAGLSGSPSVVGP